MSDYTHAAEFARAIKYWRWCWNCGTRGMDCPVAGRPEGGDPRCCPDCWHSDYAPSTLELAEAKAEIARLTEELQKMTRQRDAHKSAAASPEHKKRRLSGECREPPVTPAA